jgi:dTDP-4-amino-4,6-dideoxygalactose transaminase
MQGFARLRSTLREPSQVLGLELKGTEDLAQTLGPESKGKRTGSFGLAGCFSFYPFKLLGGFGDGGAVTTMPMLPA